LTEALKNVIVLLLFEFSSPRFVFV